MLSRGRVALEGDARNSKSGGTGEARILRVGPRLRIVGQGEEKGIKNARPNRRTREKLLDRASSRLLCLEMIGSCQLLSKGSLCSLISLLRGIAKFLGEAFRCCEVDPGSCGEGIVADDCYVVIVCLDPCGP